jgi:hypothetical protein
VEGHWTREDARIIKRISWSITDDVINRSQLNLPILIKHWSKRLFQASQRWCASLNI